MRLTRRSAFALLTSLALPLVAQEKPEQSVLTEETYANPPAEIERLVTAPRHLNVSLSNQSPTRRYFVKVQSEGLPTVKDFGKPWYNLGGLQIDPKANRARTMTTRGGVGLDIIDATNGKTTSLEVPAGATVSGARWSPDGSQLAFFANFPDASYLYVADIASTKSRRLSTVALLATAVAAQTFPSKPIRT